MLTYIQSVIILPSVRVLKTLPFRCTVGKIGNVEDVKIFIKNGYKLHGLSCLFSASEHQCSTNTFTQDLQTHQKNMICRFGIVGKNQTWAARSTRIFENEVKLMCSNFNFGTIASPDALPLSLSYRDTRCCQDMSCPFCEKYS